ncbi:hypothetical protein [Terrabacter sp. C0L_2]|uniref:hypothetical protein n=1 Tax=Terrabacter sp. C0L_2 TaxID=3108389 RepID=UPI002ED3ED81|nr:hypothetical protein U5C87_15590 [Terrabacter sp. C0L_2]
MKTPLKDRHVDGVGAAACTLCCAAPLVAMLGLAGAAATAVAFTLAGLTFAIVVAGTGIALTLARRRAERAQHCPRGAAGPVDVSIGPPR